MPESQDDRHLAIYGALAANLVIAVTKFVAFLISGATGEGTEELKQAVMRYLEEHPRMPAKSAATPNEYVQ